MLKIIIGLFFTLIIVAGTVMSIAIIFSSDGRESEREQQSLEQQRDVDVLDVNSGVLVVSQDRAYNGTNPDINLKANIPQELVLVNRDSTPLATNGLYSLRM